MGGPWFQLSSVDVAEYALAICGTCHTHNVTHLRNSCSKPKTDFVDSSFTEEYAAMNADEQDDAAKLLIRLRGTNLKGKVLDGIIHVVLNGENMFIGLMLSMTFSSEGLKRIRAQQRGNI